MAVSDPRRLLVLLAALMLAAAGACSAAQHGRSSAVSTCPAPVPTGTPVRVALIDLGGMGAMMRARQSAWRTWHAGMMRMAVDTRGVPAGTVALRVTNRGSLVHELVVLPLAAGESVGNRPPAADGTVAETGALGEVSHPCAAGAGDGLRPGTSGWSDLALTAGRYEFVCNLPGHYLAGMYAELDVR